MAVFCVVYVQPHIARGLLLVLLVVEGSHGARCCQGADVMAACCLQGRQTRTRAKRRALLAMQSLENLLPVTQRSQTATPQRMLERRGASSGPASRSSAHLLSAQNFWASYIALARISLRMGWCWYLPCKYQWLLFALTWSLLYSARLNIGKDREPVSGQHQLHPRLGSGDGLFCETACVWARATCSSIRISTGR